MVCCKWSVNLAARFESCCVFCATELPHLSKLPSCAGRMQESVVSPIIALLALYGVSAEAFLGLGAGPLLFTSTLMFSDHFFFIQPFYVTPSLLRLLHLLRSATQSFCACYLFQRKAHQ